MLLCSVPELWLSDSRKKAWHVCCLSCKWEQNAHKIRTEINFCFLKPAKVKHCSYPCCLLFTVKTLCYVQITTPSHVLTVLSLTPTDLCLIDNCKVRSLLEIPYSIWKFSDGHYRFRHPWQLSKTKQEHHLAAFLQLIISWEKLARRGTQDSGDLWSGAVGNERVCYHKPREPAVTRPPCSWLEGES